MRSGLGAIKRSVTVKVKFADFRQVTRSRSFADAITRRDLLRRASVELVRTALPIEQGIRLLGVSNFDPPDDRRHRRTAAVRSPIGGRAAPSCRRAHPFW